MPLSPKVERSDERTEENKTFPLGQVPGNQFITPLALPVTMQVTDIYFKNTGYGKAVILYSFK
jgi:hypothetical protein